MSVAIATRKKITIGAKPIKPSAGQHKLRHDLGKYRRNLAGQVIEVSCRTVGVWCFRGCDADGVYYGLMGCYENNQ